MKKINKKGFTLVELLAVIVILAVILMIAVPLASTEKLAGSLFSSSTIESCYVPLTEIKLERGGYGTNYGGYVMVDNTGKGTIYYYNDSFYLNGGTISGGTVASQGNPKTNFTIPTGTTIEECTWY